MLVLAFVESNTRSYLLVPTINEVWCYLFVGYGRLNRVSAGYNTAVANYDCFFNVVDTWEKLLINQNACISKSLLVD